MTWGSVYAADDYRELLRRGHVQRVAALEEHEEWRAEMRRQARADKLRIRTFSMHESESLWAGLSDWRITDEDIRQAMQRLDALWKAINEAGCQADDGLSE